MTGHRYANKVVGPVPGDFTVEGSDVIIRTSGVENSLLPSAAAWWPLRPMKRHQHPQWVQRCGTRPRFLVCDIDQLVALAGPDSQPWVPRIAP